MDVSTTSTTPQPRRDRSTTLSSIRRAAVTARRSTLDVLNADPPLGAWAATAQASSQAPTLADIRHGSFDENGWTRSHTSRARSATSGSQTARSQGKVRPVVPRSSSVIPTTTEEAAEPFPAFEEVETPDEREKSDQTTILSENLDAVAIARERQVDAAGNASPPTYVPPPQLPWTTSSWIGFKAFLKWMTRPLGFLVTIYALNVVAWGGMLFLLLCNASPAMCNAPDGRGGTFYDCDDLYSPRRVWIEVDSQILNALFCVTGFGLIPWRFRDLYYLLRWRLCSEKRAGAKRKLFGLRKLAGINRGWFRLPGSNTLDEVSPAAYSSARRQTRSGHATIDVEGDDSSGDDLRVPLPIAKAPVDPLTGVRAPPTALWKLDFFISCQVMNTFLQAVLCGFMWGYSRFTRPSWATGLFIGLACVVAGVGGIVSYIEGRRVKRIEGVRPSPAEEREILKILVHSDKASLERSPQQATVHGSQSVAVISVEKTARELS